jgi:hypothetical protein
MTNRRLQSKRRYVKAFVIATLVFVLGFAMSYGVSYIELSRINDLQQTINYEIFSDKLDYSLFGEDICSIESYNEISQDLGIQGRIIDDLENRFGKEDRSVLFRKKFYTLALIEHFEFVKERNEMCDDFVNTILFFYSNERASLQNSEEIGRLLEVIHSRNENVVIYSLDVNLKSSLMNKLVEKYNIKNEGTLIINNNQFIENPKNLAEIEVNLK